MTTNDSINFSFVLPGIIAGMSIPGRYDDIYDDFAFIKEQGIGAILSLTEDPLPVSVQSQFQMKYLHVPVRDYTAPRQDQIEKAITFIQQNAAEQCATVVHCYAGIGRTGTIIACYLVSCGYSAVDAIEKVRVLRPGSIQGEKQENCIFLYEQMLRS